MPLRLSVTFITGRYDAAGGDDPRKTEWPPHPARAFAAMRAVAEEEDLPALEELERMPPPLIHASRASFVQSRGYVVTNVRENKGGHQTHPGRTSGFRQRISALPDSAHVQFDWPDDKGMSEQLADRLDRIATRVPYLGRSTSTAMLSVCTVDDATPAPGLLTWEPCADGDVRIRVPYPGYVDELNALHQGDQPSWQASTGCRAWRSYRMTGHETSTHPKPTLSSPYRDLVILRFLDARPPGHLVATFCEALRRQIMGQTRDPLPPALHGHGLPGVPHVAYLGLPFAGFEHADGQLFGLAVAIPGMDPQERRQILRGVLGSDPMAPTSLMVPGMHERFELVYAPDEPLPYSATEARWTRPSSQWVSVTPLVLDRFPKRDRIREAVVQSLVGAGLPEPNGVEVSTEPLIPGAVRLRPDQLPRRCKGRLYRHVRVRFEQQLEGPVLAGAGRYFGVGLFAPELDGGAS